MLDYILLDNIILHLSIFTHGRLQIYWKHTHKRNAMIDNKIL